MIRKMELHIHRFISGVKLLSDFPDPRFEAFSRLRVRTRSSLLTRDCTMATTASPPQTSASTSSPIPSRNPLPLSAAQEQQVRDLYYKRVRTRCANEIRGMPLVLTCARFNGTAFPVARWALKVRITCCCLQTISTPDVGESADNTPLITD